MTAGAIGMGIAAGATSLVSRRLGEGRREEANQAGGNALCLALIAGLASAAIGRFAARWLVHVSGATPDIEDASLTYLTTVAFGFPFIMLAGSLDGLYRASGNTTTPMWLTGWSVLINGALDPFLIYGWGPFPMLGIQGAAIATVAAQIAVCAASFLYLRRRSSGYRIRLPHLRLRAPVIREIAQVGLPALASSSLRSVVACIYNWVLASFGSEAIAANGLGHMVIMLVISCLGGGVHQALMPIVGYTFGAKDYRRRWAAYRVAAVWTSVGAFILGGIVCIFAAPILAPIARDPALLELSVLSLRLKMCTFFIVEPQMMALFSLQGMGFGSRAMLITTSRDVLLVLPGLFILAHFFGVTGAFAAQPVADVLGAFLTAAILWRVYTRYPPSAGVTRVEVLPAPDEETA